MLTKGNKFIFAISFISAFIFYIIVVSCDFFSTKYMVLIGAILIIIYLFIFMLMKKFSKKWVQIILVVIESIFVVGFVLGSIILYQTNHFMLQINKKTEEQINYYVVIRKTSNYRSIKDIKGNIGTYSLNDDYDQVAFKRIPKSLNITTSQDLLASGKALLNQKVEALLLRDFYYEFLREDDHEFEQSTKILMTIKVPLKAKEKKSVSTNKPVFSVLISGIDTGGSINTVSRSDVNIVVTINTQTHEVLLTSIPRDYYVKLSGIPFAKDKLTHAGLYGIEMSRSTIADLLETEIDEYIKVNFDTVVKLVDAIGGIEVESDVGFRAYSGDYFQKGINYLDGKKTLSYARERKSFQEGDRKRGSHQEEVIMAIAQKMTSSTILLENYLNILRELEDVIETSISPVVMKKFVKMQIDQMPSWSIKTLNLDGTDGMAYPYSIPNQYLYVMIPDDETLKKARDVIKKMKSNQSFQMLGI